MICCWQTLHIVTNSFTGLCHYVLQVKILCFCVENGAGVTAWGWTLLLALLSQVAAAFWNWEWLYVVCTKCSASSVLFIAVDPSLTDLILLREISKTEGWCFGVFQLWNSDTCLHRVIAFLNTVLHHTLQSIVVSMKCIVLLAKVKGITVHWYEAYI